MNASPADFLLLAINRTIDNTLARDPSRSVHNLRLCQEWLRKHVTSDPSTTQKARQSMVDEFIDRVRRETGREITRTDLARAAKHKTPRQFQRWQRGDPKATRADNINFSRILAQEPAEFLKELDTLKKCPRK